MAIGQSFNDVLDAARAGGDWAWASIYEDLAPPLLGYIRSLGAREPEDLLGEVFVQVVRGLPDFEGDEAGFRSWVFVIAHHRVVDERRHPGRRAEILTPAERLDSVAPGDVADDALEPLRELAALPVTTRGDRAPTADDAFVTPRSR